MWYKSQSSSPGLSLSPLGNYRTGKVSHSLGSLRPSARGMETTVVPAPYQRKPYDSSTLRIVDQRVQLELVLLDQAIAARNLEYWSIRSLHTLYFTRKHLSETPYHQELSLRSQYCENSIGYRTRLDLLCSTARWTRSDSVRYVCSSIVGTIPNTLSEVGTTTSELRALVWLSSHKTRIIVDNYVVGRPTRTYTEELP